MKITLILAASPNDPLRRNDPFMPLSLPLLAGAAPEHDYSFVDMLAGEEVDFSRPVDLVGISVRLTAEKTAFQIADEFKKKGIPVVLGGPQVSSVPFRATEHSDAVAVGEGEVLWPAILDDLKYGRLKQIYVASPEKFDAGDCSLHQIPSYLDLASVPSALRQYYRKSYVFDTVFASRGCPIDCDFCSVPHLFGKVVRHRPVQEVVKEIDSFENFYYLLDDNVFGRPASYDYYSELYDAIAKLGKTRFWTGQANLDAAANEKGQEVIRKAAEAGFLYAAIGMESINPQVLKKSGAIRKQGATSAEDVVERMKENIRFVQDQGILVSGWFTIGYEEDNIDTFYETMAFCKEMNIIPIICPLEALPGTRLFERLNAEGRVDHQKTINVVHPTMKDEEILKALAEVTKDGFSMKQILKRTHFYSKKFGQNGNGLGRRIESKM
ncbi:MAG: radical SAM protein, partial [Pseudomonadota bacterium]